MLLHVALFLAFRFRGVSVVLNQTKYWRGKVWD